MTVKELVKNWQDQAHGTLTKDKFTVNLAVEDAARIDALSEMYPKRSKEQLISELISAALAELESSFPYVQGSEVVATDELGDPIFADVGPTPKFLSLTKKYLSKYNDAAND
ncbi:hypothetical protein TDB9533_02161 [Thalassocella blandensis]|nr:hypothetical protein TDB9533_02161 [Thalassocella blandensis]